MLNFVGNLLQYGSYGYNVYQERVAQSTANIVAGSITQKAIEVPAGYAVDRFLDSHRRTLSSSKSSYIPVAEPPKDSSETAVSLRLTL